jgi:capsular exopolysaccharide synthesis family protein
LKKRRGETMEPRRYFKVIKRWWWLLIVGMIIPTSISYRFLSQQPALYQAKVTLMVGTDLQQPSLDPDTWGIARNLAQVYAELVKLRPITQEVIQRLNLEKSPEELVVQITAGVIHPEAQLLEIIVTDTSPQAAALIANALADELIRQSTGSDPEIQQRRARVQEQLAELEETIANTEEQIKELEDSLANAISAAEIEETRRRLSGLQGVLADLRLTYVSSLQFLIDSSANILTVVEPAIEPTLPVSSGFELILLGSGAAGLALTLGAAFVIEFLDDTLRWESCKDRTLLDLQVVGLMPRLPQEHGHISTDISLESSKAEALRLLRANIFLTLARRSISTTLATSPGRREGTTTILASPISTLLVASPGRREGTTTIVASLGMVIASGGQRVIIVDGDLRTPDLHEVFGLPNDYGLCELLLGQDPSLPKALQETSIPNLNLLAAGRPPLDLALALTSPRLVELFEALREQADIIIFDSPPVLLAPDTAVLSGLVEGTLLVVRDGHTTMESASRAKERLSAYQGAPIMGVLFSRARLDGWTLFPRRRRRPGPLIAPPSVSEQRLGEEEAEERYPPLDQGVEAEPAEGLAVKSQVTEGEDGSK